MTEKPKERINTEGTENTEVAEKKELAEVDSRRLTVDRKTEERINTEGTENTEVAEKKELEGSCRLNLKARTLGEFRNEIWRICCTNRSKC